MWSWILKTAIGMVGSKFGVPILIAAMYFGMNSLHAIKNRFENRQIHKAAYAEGYDAASKRCIEGGGEMRRRRFFRFLREEQRPQWHALLELGYDPGPQPLDLGDE